MSPVHSKGIWDPGDQDIPEVQKQQEASSKSIELLRDPGLKKT